MLELIKEENVEVGVHAADWEDAIRRSAQHLLETGKIEERYIRAMIDAVHRVGPYIVLGNHVALAHARPECGVNELSVHFTTLEPPIPFGSEKFDPVSLIITLAAVDADSHLELISELADILMEETHVERLSSCTTEREFVELLRRMKEESNAYYISYRRNFHQVWYPYTAKGPAGVCDAGGGEQRCQSIEGAWHPASC